MATKKNEGYEPQEWVKGRSKFTAARMRHIEQGVAAAHERVASIEARLAALEGSPADE